MKRRKLKQGVWISLYLILIVGIVASAFALRTAMNSVPRDDDDLDYVSSSILEEDVPVINEVEKMVKPYTAEGVSVAKTYYDYQADAASQEKSIVYHDNTYMQNSGVDYVLENAFDVVSVLDGTVTKVSEDDLVGKTIEVKHDNDYVTVYQSLSEVSVKKGDSIKQGQVIGKSGANKLDSDLGNHLHFELYVNGQVVNPESYVDKEIKKEKDESKETTSVDDKDNNSTAENSNSNANTDE